MDNASPDCVGARSGQEWLHSPLRPVLVVDGPADLFAHRRGADDRPTRRHFVARVPEGAVVPAVPSGSTVIEIVPLPGTTLSRLPGGPLGAAQVDGLDRTLMSVAESIREGQGPRDAMSLRTGELVSVDAGSSIMGNSHGWWVRIVGGGVRRNGGGPGHDADDGQIVLLAGRDWLEIDHACTVESMRSAVLQRAGLLDAALAEHLTRLLVILEHRITRVERKHLDAVEERRVANAAGVAYAARTALGAVGARAGRAVVRDDTVIARYRRMRTLLELVLGSDRGVVREPADQRVPPASDEAGLQALARSSSLHLREVELPAKWWRHDLGPLLGWRTPIDSSGDGAGAPAEAVALVHRRQRYHTVDPVTGHRQKVTEALAGRLRPTATQVQVPLDSRGGIGRALRLGVRGSLSDGRAMLTAGLISACLGLASPLVTGHVLGSVAENASAGQLRSFPLLLVAAAVVAAITTAAQNLRLLRLEGRAENATQLVLWDRLLRLPVTFFRSQGSGELANAVLGVSFIRESLAGITAGVLTGVFTALGSTVLILVVAPQLGGYALAVIGLCVVACTVLGRSVVLRGRRALPSEHRTAAFMNHLLGGIAKIKLAHAEDRAYTQWALSASEARRQLIAVRRVQAAVTALSAVLPIAGQLVLFLVLAGPLSNSITATQFFTVNIAFSTLLGALLIIVSGSVEIMGAIPRLSVLRPIVTAEPERRPDLLDPGDLRGGVSLVGVHFTYHPDDPPVLQDVNLGVKPGEFVAVVGPSGCGKSTLLRLLLGFEHPSAGAVLYDEQDLSGLDAQAVRRQCGVVLQDGQLFAGSIRENICGASKASLEQAWDAAALAGIDRDIDALPMGMGTLVPPGGGTLSVGQRQRILIARALIHRPRVVFFDEATSALDNRTQETVTSSTRELAATRVVIAHRLSTVVDADRIVVMERGRIVQVGTFAELMAEPDGLFVRLATRQLVAPPLPAGAAADTRGGVAAAQPELSSSS